MLFVPGDVHVSNGLAVLRGKDNSSSVLAVVHTDNTNTSHWNGSHLKIADLIVEARGIVRSTFTLDSKIPSTMLMVLYFLMGWCLLVVLGITLLFKSSYIPCIDCR